MTIKNAPISDNALKIAEIAATLFPSYIGSSPYNENTIDNEFPKLCHIVKDIVIELDKKLSDSSSN